MISAMKRPFSPMLALVAFFALTVAFGTAHAQGLRAEIG